MDRSAISKVLFNDRVSLEEKAKIAFLAEDFLLIKNKVKPKKTIGLTFFYVKICKNINKYLGKYLSIDIIKMEVNDIWQIESF